MWPIPPDTDDLRWQLLSHGGSVGLASVYLVGGPEVAAVLLWRGSWAVQINLHRKLEWQARRPVWMVPSRSRAIAWTHRWALASINRLRLETRPPPSLLEQPFSLSPPGPVRRQAGKKACWFTQPWAFQSATEGPIDDGRLDR